MVAKYNRPPRGRCSCFSTTNPINICVCCHAFWCLLPYKPLLESRHANHVIPIVSSVPNLPFLGETCYGRVLSLRMQYLACQGSDNCIAPQRLCILWPALRPMALHCLPSCVLLPSYQELLPAWPLVVVAVGILLLRVLDRPRSRFPVHFSHEMVLFRILNCCDCPPFGRSSCVFTWYCFSNISFSHCN